MRVDFRESLVVDQHIGHHALLHGCIIEDADQDLFQIGEIARLHVGLATIDNNHDSLLLPLGKFFLLPTICNHCATQN